MIKWLELKEDTEYEDVIISSRVRLARNLRRFNFINNLDIIEASEVSDRFKKAVEIIDKDNKYSVLAIKDIDSIDRRVLMEEHLISPELIKNKDISYSILNKQNNVNLMINEEDHLRLQILMPGLDLYKAYDMAVDIDIELEKYLDFAFDSKFGYLTTCPTNTGSGMRASVMMHLPALKISNLIQGFIDSLAKLGLTIRGVYGEGSKALGDMFQISNQQTIGFTEQEVIDKLENIVLRVTENERESRIDLIDKRKNFVEDKIYRALGILKYSRIITSEEALENLSFLRMGISLDLYNKLTFDEVTYLMLTVQKYSVLKYKYSLKSFEDENVVRAKYIRDFFEKEEV